MFHLPALKAIARTEFSIVLADPNAKRLDQLAGEFGATLTVQDFRELEGKVDGVIVATPPATHHEISDWFLRRGVNVLCEKPLTECIDQARDLVETAQQTGAALAVNQTRRLFPTYQKIRELIEAGALGKIKSISYHDGIEFDWPAASSHHFAEDARGAWSDTGVHLLDTICFWLGATPDLVASHNDSFGGPEALATVRLRYAETDIELKVSRLGRLKNGFTIEGERGRIEADAEEWAQVMIEFPNGRRRRIRCGRRDQEYTGFAKPLIENFVDVIAEGKRPITTGEDVLGTIDLLSRAYEQSQPFPMPWNQQAAAQLRVVSSLQRNLPRVLVTGASGFLGGRVVETMALGDQYAPVAALRGWSRAPRVARHPVEIRLCDINDSYQVDRAVADVDAIVHCAKTDDHESIVCGTRNLLEAAERHGVGKFVFLSTAEVYGPAVSGNVRETEPTEPTGRVYGDAKIEAERLCAAFSARSVATTVLRPSLIYGPFSASWSIDLAKRLQSGNWGMFDQSGDGIANLIYVDDLVDAILRCIENEAASGEVFNVNGPDHVTWNEYFEEFNQTLGLPPLKRISVTRSRLRTRFMDAVGCVADKILDRYEDKLMEIYLRGGIASRVMRRVKGELNSTPTGTELHDLFGRTAFYDDSKIRNGLGFQPAYSLQRGLSMTVAWLRLHELAEPSQNEDAVNARDSFLATPPIQEAMLS